MGPYLPSAALESRSEEWVGARPLTPDGIPVVDKLPGLSSTYIAAGHNMLGLMHAPFTAEILKDMVLRRGMLRHRQFAASRTF
ncbi:MAG: FAD-dependent oxidoreductase [Brevibacterium aurantiacum]